MTEERWLACDDAGEMLLFLRGLVSDRRMRLFACAFARRVWGLFDDQRSRDAIEVSERYADGLATAEHLSAAAGAAHDAYFEGMDAASAVLPLGLGNAYTDANELTDPDRLRYDDFLDAVYFSWSPDHYRCDPLNEGEKGLVGWTKRVAELASQVSLLRDIFGNPFRPVALAPACRTPAVLALAQAAYDERALPSGELDAERLAVLADALEDAGAAGDILAHLRGPGPHVRGCWALDLALGKE